MRRLFSRLLIRLYAKKGITITRFQEEFLLGKKYKVLSGSIKKRLDYDSAWLFALAHDAEIVFDIGCNIGQSALLMMHTNHIQEIVLVEPNPSALGQAANNLIFNHLSQKAHFVCAFASDEEGQEVTFYTVGAGAAGSMYSTHAQTAARMHSSISVPTITIDALVEDYQMIPDLVKIDVEGAETKVLSGSGKLAAKQKTRFFVEVHSSPISMSDNATKIIDWCHNNDYQAWYLKEKVLLTDPNQIAHRGRCHLLLLPKNQSFPEYLRPLKQGARLEEVSGL